MACLLGQARGVPDDAGRQARAGIARSLARRSSCTQCLRRTMQRTRGWDWPRHQRPTKWVVELARTRLLELKAHLARHSEAPSPIARTHVVHSLLRSEHIGTTFRSRPASHAPATATVAQRLSRSAAVGKTRQERTAVTAPVNQRVRQPLLPLLQGLRAGLPAEQKRSRR
jgi:hypothetical protein